MQHKNAAFAWTGSSTRTFLLRSVDPNKRPPQEKHIVTELHVLHVVIHPLYSDYFKEFGSEAYNTKITDMHEQ